MIRKTSLVLTAALAAWLALAPGAHAAEVSVAVAANFAAPMKVIAEDFERASGHKVSLSFGATGQLYAQIRNGAPFAILLSADDHTPARLENEGLGMPGSRFTYAIGRLVLWSKTPGMVDPEGKILMSGSFRRIAVANPKLAPYGNAAIETLQRLGVLDAVRPKFVEGANVGQTFQFVSSGNASLGFVAMSQVYEHGKLKEGSAWIVPPQLHSVIRQDAILLRPGNGNPAADALLKYLRGPNARATIRAYGYDL